MWMFCRIESLDFTSTVGARPGVLTKQLDSRPVPVRKKIKRKSHAQVGIGEFGNQLILESFSMAVAN